MEVKETYFMTGLAQHSNLKLWGATYYVWLLRGSYSILNDFWHHSRGSCGASTDLLESCSFFLGLPPPFLFSSSSFSRHRCAILR
jgi:hypothetical protein